MALAGRKNSAQLIVAFCVLGMFVIFSLVLIAFGARAYSHTGEEISNTDQLRTSLNYVANKVRFSSGGDAVNLESVDGIEVLTVSEGEYQSCIYFYDGQLRECYLEDLEDFSPETGDVILEISDFQMEEDDGLLCLEACTEDGESMSLEIDSMGGLGE